MGRLTYATPEDVIRLALGGTVGRASVTSINTAIDNNDILGTEDDRAYLETLIDRAEAKWDREAAPMKPVPVGSADVPKYHDGKGKPWPVRLFLDHTNIHPFDANSGDFLELRTGRDQYRDVTSEEGTTWTADYEKGIITIHRAPGRGQLPSFYRIQDKFAKVSYRLAAGGDLFNAGQTTLGENISDSQTGSVSVADASRLPESGETVLLGGVEYAYVSSADHDADTITIDERGVDFTSATSHSSGDVVHFCPSEVRDAVGLIAGIRLIRSEDFTEALFDSDMNRGDKIEAWNAEIDATMRNYSDTGGFG